MESDSRLRCSQCPATFRRIEHLRRHLASHGNERPYQCCSCTASFKRRDALKRHWKSCRFHVDTGIDLFDIFETPQGKKARRACDRCARLKKACTFDHPCTACRAKNKSCSYERLGLLFVRSDPDVSSIFDSPSNLGRDATPLSSGLLPSSQEISLINWDLSVDPFQSSLGALPRASSTTIGGDRAGTLVYLSRVTTVTGLSNSFECHLYWQQDEMSDSVSAWSLCAVDDPWNEPLIWQSATASDTTPSSLGLMDWAGDPLLPQTLAIVDQFTRLASSTRVSNAADHQSVSVTSGLSQFMESMCIRFFSPPNIRRYLKLFWRLWYPHCPIVHRASFQAESTPPLLLATMLVIGACVSSHEADKETAKLWFDRLEAIAFSPELVSSAQNAGPAERLKCLQTMTLNFVFLLDAAFTIFYNSPPQMVLSELQMDLIYPEECFQAGSAETCLIYYRRRTSVAASAPWQEQGSSSWPTLTLRTAVRRICQAEEIPLEMQSALAEMGTLNLFLIIAALHNVLFHAQSAAVDSRFPALENGLGNWKRVWEKHQQQAADDANGIGIGIGTGVRIDTCSKGVIGFMRHAEEYWLLANILLDRFRDAQRDGVDTDLDSAGPGRGNLDGPHGNGMDQLKNLIMEFRGVC
ncbi:uncharacterized protein BJX67DRAFT_379826 [Aspergillus lucknowensis]|uniref:Uncharacterized protein n=1 Tax=Aspergillus lucknowensis TaxID=176173 RepID=A0ABR4LWH5_9EURO